MHLFPFEKVNRNERVVIYGAGAVGQQFLQQIEKTGYCSIVAILDQKFYIYKNVNSKVCAVDKIKNLSYDKIIIAIESPNIAYNVRDKLMKEYHVPGMCIVMGCGRKVFSEKDKASSEENLLKSDNISNYMSIVFFISSGLGDIIIAKVFIESFMKTIVPTLRADISTSPSGFAFAKALLGNDDTYVRNIVVRGNAQEYDLAISAIYGLRILNFREHHVRKVNPVLADVVCELQEKIQKYELDFAKGSQYRIHFDRCRVAKYTCYTAFEYYGICPIMDWHTRIPLLGEHVSDFQNLRLRKFITINFGWGLSDEGIGKLPNKIWPIKYYNVFVRLFKKMFPEIQVVQVGLENSARVDGVDVYVFGKSLEIVKYVLKKSILHLDCEGGLVHLATQLGTKCVVLFGPTPVYYFGYKENINIVAKTCYDCCYMYDDFSVCARGLDEPECMYSIMPEFVMGKVKEYLERLEVKGNPC